MLEDTSAGKASGKPAGKRRKNPEATKANIIAIATEEFAAHGLSGARIDEIASKTNTSKRMIYYYFGDKEGLYRRVLEACYDRVRAGEAGLELENLPPAEAMKALVEFTFDHHRSNPDFVRLVMIENIHNAEHLVVSDVIQSANQGVIEKISDIYRAGVETGAFRPGLKPLRIHWLISALAFFNVSNRSTFSRIFDWPVEDAKNQKALKKDAVDTVMGYVLN